jgi:DNA-binding NtrC family response regulator/tetratricopeptide (TPR) repeat protein
MKGDERRRRGGEASGGPQSPESRLPVPGAIAAPPDIDRLLQVAEIHWAADDAISALNALEEALTRVDEYRGPAVLRAEILLRIVDSLRKRGDLEGALVRVEEVRGLLDPNRDPILTGRAFSRQSYVLNGLGRYDEALEAGERAYALLKPSNEHVEIGFLEIARGTIYVRRGDVARSRECFENALFAFRRVEHQEGIALALNNLGLLLKNGPQWADARDFLTRALAVSEAAGNYNRIATHCVNLGILFTKLCDWELAAQHLSRSVSINRELGNDYALVKSLLARGHLCRRRGQVPEAATLYREARALCTRHGYGRELVLCDEADGDLLADAGERPLARERWLQGLGLALEVAPDGDLVPELKRRLAALALAEGQVGDARRLAVQSYRESLRLGENTEAGAALRILGEGLARTRSLDTAGALLERSVEMLARTPERLELALSQTALARFLRQSCESAGATHAEGHVERAVDLAQKAWEFFASVDLAGPMADALVELAHLRVEFGRLDEALRDLSRAYHCAREAGRSDLVERVRILRERLDERSAAAARMTSPEGSIIEEWAKIFNGDQAGEACLANMLRFVVLRLEGHCAFIASPEPGTPSGYGIEACTHLTTEQAAGILEIVAPPVRERGICLAAEVPADPILARHAHGALDGVQSLAALPLHLPDGDGILYLDRRKAGTPPFGGTDLRLLGLLAGLLGLGLVQLRREKEIHRGRLAALEGERDDPFAAYVTMHRPIRQVFAHLARVGDSTASILVQGETGTGKGLLAQCVHRASARRDQPFVAVNCAALPESLLESELFGHVQGSFTGANRRKRGLFEEASGGTLFLDEISRTTLSVQAKLLHVVDTREVRPVGATRGHQVDVRLICASNVDLREAIRRGTFLEDLFYRLNDFSVLLPPLRERREDIPLLVAHFYDEACREMGRRPRGLSQDLMAGMLEHEWRGNIRELMQVVRRLVALSEDGEWIGTALLPAEFDRVVRSAQPAESSTLRDEMARLEARMIAEALAAAKWNRSMAARRLQISYPNLLSKIKLYRLDPPRAAGA